MTATSLAKSQLSRAEIQMTKNGICSCKNLCLTLEGLACMQPCFKKPVSPYE